MKFTLRTNARFFNDKELLEDLQKVAKKLNKPTVTFREYVEHGSFSTKVFSNRFGSWNEALVKAGLGISQKYNLSEIELFENLETVWRSLGRQPFYGEMVKPVSKYTAKPYVARWNGWMNACKAFISYKQGDVEFLKVARESSSARSRNINEKTRLRVLKRDHYKCQKCGRSPATHRELFLHIDHITPFSKGGSNDFDNLQTLCNKCNLGKNNDETV